MYTLNNKLGLTFYDKINSYTNGVTQYKFE